MVKWTHNQKIAHHLSY